MTEFFESIALFPIVLTLGAYQVGLWCRKKWKSPLCSPLLIALCTGLLKPAHIADTAHFLIGIMPLLFVAPAAKIMAYWGVIKENWLPIIAITVISTFVVFAVSGLVTKWLRKGGKNDG